MKTILLFLLGLIIFIPVYSQIYTNEVKVIDTGGKVGIGISAPSQLLQIYKSGNTENLISFGNDEWHVGNTNTNNFIIYRGASSQLYITSGGNVGIGTSSPVEKLTVQNGNIVNYGNGLNLNNFGAYLHQDFNDGSLPSDFSLNSQVSGSFPGPGSIIRLTSTGSDPQFMWNNLSINGGIYRYIVFKLRYVSGSTTVQGTTYYSSGSHGYSESYRQSYNVDISGNWKIYVLDMWTLAAGGTDWQNNNIISIRCDWSNNMGGVFDLDWIAIGSDSPSPLTNIYEKSGNVGIGLVSPSYKLHVNGPVGATAFTQTSDLRLKNIYGTILGVDIIKKYQTLNLYSYRFKKEEQISGNLNKHIGVIAQEIEQVFPEFVSTDQEGIKSVDYSSLAVTAIAAIKELQDEIKELRNNNDIQEEKYLNLINELTKRVEVLEMKISQEYQSNLNSK